MRGYMTSVLVPLLLVPLLAWASPAGAETRLPVLPSVAVSSFMDETGYGLKLTFPSHESRPALAEWSLAEAREVVTTLEGAFKEARSEPRPTFSPDAHTTTCSPTRTARPMPRAGPGRPCSRSFSHGREWAWMIRRTSSTCGATRVLIPKRIIEKSSADCGVLLVPVALLWSAVPGSSKCSTR